MKKLVINLLFSLALSFSLLGQTVNEQFSGFGNITSVTSLGSGNYTVGLSGFTGSPRFEINGQWEGTDIAVGDVLFRDGARYVVTLVNSSTSGGFNVRVNSPDEGLGVSSPNNGDIVAVGREFMQLIPIPRQGDNAGTGVPPSLASSIYIHNMKIMANLGADYVTTDSFSTFTNGMSFAQIPLNKTVWRTTTGSKFEKTSATAMTRRSTDNGENARLGFTQTGNTLLFNANLYNKVRLSSGNISSATIQTPNNYLIQETGESFLIGITSGNIPLTVTWDTIYGSFDGTTFTQMPNTVLGQNSTVYFKFRIINPASEQTKFQYVDGTGGGAGTPPLVHTQTAHGYTNADVGKVVYINTDGEVKLAQADMGVADSVAQWVISKRVDADELELCNNCFVTLPSGHGIAPNSYIWLSQDEGNFVDTVPSGRNTQFLGKVTTATEAYFQIGDITHISGATSAGLSELYLPSGLPLANGDTIAVSTIYNTSDSIVGAKRIVDMNAASQSFFLGDFVGGDNPDIYQNNNKGFYIDVSSDGSIGFANGDANTLELMQSYPGQTVIGSYKGLGADRFSSYTELSKSSSVANQGGDRASGIQRSISGGYSGSPQIGEAFATWGNAYGYAITGINSNSTSVLSGKSYYILLGNDSVNTNGNSSIGMINDKMSLPLNHCFRVQRAENSPLKTFNWLDIDMDDTTNASIILYNNKYQLPNAQPAITNGTKSIMTWTGNGTATTPAFEAQPKKYVALLTQTGTNAPVATVLENTLGGTVVWTRTGTGNYEATLSGAFTTGKTAVFYNNEVHTIAQTNCYRFSANVIKADTYDSTNLTLIDGGLYGTLEIRVYP